MKNELNQPSGSALVGCECSGVVRDALRAVGVDAWSCDLKPCEKGSPYHIQGDVIAAIKSRKWGMIGIHPECTKLAVSGNRWYGSGTPGNALRIAALSWTLELWKLATESAKHVYMENPVGVLTQLKELPKPQYVQPWQFGHGETKKTGFWLHGLPHLEPTSIVEGREQRVWKMPPSAERQANRSRTFQGIGVAIADQWGQLIAGQNVEDSNT